MESNVTSNSSQMSKKNKNRKKLPASYIAAVTSVDLRGNADPLPRSVMQNRFQNNISSYGSGSDKCDVLKLSWPELPKPSSSHGNRNRAQLSNSQNVVDKGTPLGDQEQPQELDFGNKVVELGFSYSNIIKDNNNSEQSNSVTVLQLKERGKTTSQVSSETSLLCNDSAKVEENLFDCSVIQEKREISQVPEVENEGRRPRQRKKAQKEEKRRAREEEMRRKIVAPKGQSMRIVSQKMLEAFLNSNAESVSVSHYPPNMSEIEFPTVQEAKKSRAKQDDQHTGEPQIAQVPARIKKRKDLIHIDLFNLIKTQPASSKKKNLDKGVSRVQKRDNTMRYTGNQLDASNPERKRGKMKEVPKKKKVTVLKSAILEARALRRHLRALQEQAMTLTEPPSFDSSATTMQSIGDINTEPQQSQERPEKLLLHSRRFREYCDHSVTSSLNMAVKLLLKDIVKFQDRQYQRDPVKAFAKRRYVIGFREVKKSLQLKKLKLIVIAPDMEVSKTKGGIEDTVEELKVGATAQEVTYLFALSRRELGFLTFKKVGVSCIGICSYDGSEANYEAVMEALSEARTHYNIQTGYSGQKVAVVAPEETTEKKPITVTDQVIASLLQKLSTKCEEKEEMSPFLSAISQSTG